MQLGPAWLLTVDSGQAPRGCHVLVLMQLKSGSEWHGARIGRLEDGRAGPASCDQIHGALTDAQYDDGNEEDRAVTAMEE